jgi:4a-hydroxytetrahydrobiopterin dehydratase
MHRKLNADEIAQALAKVPQWKEQGDMLRRELKFADFSAAWGFMNRVALAAEALNHHPNWSNVYNRVTIELSTHDVGGISERDFELARRIDAIV